MTSSAFAGSDVKVVVAIDFGTYGVGVGWSVISDANSDASSRHVNFFTRWPGQPIFYPKAMSCLLVDSTGKPVDWGYPAYRRWRARRGEPQLVGHRLVKGYKMSLNPNRKPPKTRGLMAIDDRETNPGKLITHYLRKVYELATEELRKSGYTPDDIRWCLTVPAMWDNHQKQIMRKAAESAGIAKQRLMLVGEPEAAAYYARVSGVRIAGPDGNAADSGLDLRTTGMRFVVADCGGGTVDLTAYESLADGAMSEIGRSEGAATGSFYLNEAFREKILIPKLGGIAEYKRLCTVCPDAIEDLLDGCESAKLDIGLNPKHPILLPISHALYTNLSDDAKSRLEQTQQGDTDNIVVSPQQIRAMFDIVAEPILGLIDEQLAVVGDDKSETAYVLLVGGFANSPHLQQRLAAHLRDRATVLIPPNPGAAVLIGAVHYAYEPQTRQRRSKYTYAFRLSKPFEACDPIETRAETWDGSIVCNDRLEILVRADEVVGTFDLVDRVVEPVYADQKAIKFDIYRTRDADPRYATQPGRELVGVVDVDIRKAMHLAVDKRTVIFSCCFGDTEISARAVLELDGTACETTVKFHARPITERAAATSALMSQGS